MGYIASSGVIWSFLNMCVCLGMHIALKFPWYIWEISKALILPCIFLFNFFYSRACLLSSVSTGPWTSWILVYLFYFFQEMLPGKSFKPWKNFVESQLKSSLFSGLLGNYQIGKSVLTQFFFFFFKRTKSILPLWHEQTIPGMGDAHQTGEWVVVGGWEKMPESFLPILQWILPLISDLL